MCNSWFCSKGKTPDDRQAIQIEVEEFRVFSSYVISTDPAILHFLLITEKINRLKR